MNEATKISDTSKEQLPVDSCLSDSLENENRISERTVARLRWYLYAIDDFEKQGKTVVSSQAIATKVGVKSGLVRKDLCHFGGFGRPSVGYNIAYLKKQIRSILRVNQAKSVAWVGAQRLSYDPALVEKLAINSWQVMAVFDKEPADFGQIEDLEVLPLDHIQLVVQKMGIEAAVISASIEEAQKIADSLVLGGVKAILNLTPAVLSVRPGVSVRNIDIVGEMIMLSYYCGEDEQKQAENAII